MVLMRLKSCCLRLYLHDSVWCSHCQEKLWPVRTLKVEPPDDRIGGGYRFLAGTLGSRGCNAFLFLADFAIDARQEAQVFSSLLAGLDGSLRKQESRRF